MSDDAVCRALARLARRDSSPREVSGPTASANRSQTFRATIERATTATEDLGEAAAFIEEVGLDELERAVERAEQSVSACAADGQRALDAFREFGEVARGDRASEASGGSIADSGEAVGDHFHPGHGTSLGRGDIGQSK